LDQTSKFENINTIDEVCCPKWTQNAGPSRKYCPKGQYQIEGCYCYPVNHEENKKVLLPDLNNVLN